MLAGVGHYVAVTVAVAIVHRDTGRTMPAAIGLSLLHPVSILLTMALLLNGVRACLGGTVTWRGNVVRA